MANKETQELIIEAIDYYVANSLCKNDKLPAIDVMRKIVKLDDIKKGLEAKDNEN